VARGARGVGVTALGDTARLVQLSAGLVAGKRFWVLPLLVLFWSLYWAIALFAGWRPQDFSANDVQGLLIGFPLTILGVGLGIRVVATDIDRRMLEIAYTVPGGAQRIWLARLAAAVAILLVAEALLAVVTFVVFTEYPPQALYGALQPAIVYLVLSMALSTLFKSEATGGLATVAVLVLNGLVTGFGSVQLRISPFWNPLELDQTDAADVLAWTVQNRVGFALVVVAITVLAFARAENREKMLAG